MDVISTLLKDQLGRLCNLDLPPEEFLASHSAFAQSSIGDIQATYTDLAQRGYYLGGMWQDILDSNFYISECCWAALINEIFTTASLRSPELTGSQRENAWCPRTLCYLDDQCKPAVVFVPKSYQHVKSADSGTILTCIVVKESMNDANRQAAVLQLYQYAGHVTACQINRSFFLGAMFLGRDLVLSLFARGASFYSKPSNIDEEPTLFIKTVIALSSGFHPVLGFDTRFLPTAKFGTHLLEWGNRTVVISRRAWARKFALCGRGTTVPLCRDIDDATQVFALKDCWLPCNSDGPNDVTNNTVLTSRKPKPMTKEQHEIFGEEDKYDIFRDCLPTRGTQWDYQIHLPGIPILEHAEFATFHHHGKYQADTTEAIARRFSSEVDLMPRVHVRTLSKTCGVPLSWFSCRREFVGGVMCVVAAHFNGELKGLLHCDVTGPNIWICLNDPENVDDVIPNWPADPTSYPRHAFVLGDWGVAMDRFPDSEVTKCTAAITGSYAFISAELVTDEGLKGNVPHDTHHDLESMFWVMWVMSINATGPYNQQRAWAEPMSAFMGLDRKPTDATGKNKPVPVWATPGFHSATVQDVHEFERTIPEQQFFDAMSPYWTEGECGQAFRDGMRRLRDHFVWVRQSDGAYAPPKTITPEIFVEILAGMRRSIPPDQDRATSTEVEEARRRYAKLMQEPDEELGTPVLGPSSGMSCDSDSGELVSMLAGNKRKAMQTSSSCVLRFPDDAKRLRMD